MRVLDRAGFEAEAAQVDACVAQTEGIDLFCSSTLWALSADEALMPTRTPWLRSLEGGYIAMAHGHHPSGWKYVQPLEGMWGMSNPFLGRAQEALVEGFVREALSPPPSQRWDVLLLSGLRRGSRQVEALERGFRGRYRVRVEYPRFRYLASLEGGLEGFLGRRDRKTRANLRRAQRQSAEIGLEYEEMPHRGDGAALYARILRIEAASWKGQEGVGINQGDMRRFYERIIDRMMARGLLRGLFLRDGEGRDLGYLLGGIFAGTFRGLQFSHLRSHAAYSLGNLSHVKMVEVLEREGGVGVYDLGSEMEYKRKWAEEADELVMALVTR